MTILPYGELARWDLIEAILRTAAGTDLVAVLPGPRDAEAIRGIVGCISALESIDEGEILATCRHQLPFYMVPARIFSFEQMPVDVNGKVDRSALEMELAVAAGGDVHGT